MKRFVLVLCFLWAIPAVASHIVGGEFEVIHLSGYQYRINLILYFDELNGSDGARDPNVEARIFRKRDNHPMMDVFLPFFSQTPVSYTQPACSEGEIVTSKIIYTAVVMLTPEYFSDPEGYYISWERCCRNYSITNVYSSDPTRGGMYAGQTFYLEFPPVTKNGQPFVNSSPRLFPPLNDYACPRRPYYVDFAGTDDDGDSLVYSLVTPLNTKSADALPLPDYKPRPAPYPVVQYTPLFSESNIMGGAPDLHISEDGFLTVTPTMLGLFVFAVKCEEYRDGVKIGEVRRDFQMLVVDGCAPAEPPQILGKKLGDPAFAYDDDMEVTFSHTVGDANRCIEVEISDKDALRPEDNFSENVRIRAIPLGFKRDVSGILPEVTSATLVNGSTKTFRICFDRCPYLQDGPFQVGIVAYDDACSLPLTDTLKITVNIEPPPNAPVRFVTPDVTALLAEGESRAWPIHAVDDDLDALVVGVTTDGFDMASAGMRIENVLQADGSYQAQLVWDAYCDIYDFTGRTSFTVKILADDVDECTFANPDEMVFNLSVDLPDNSQPVISTDLTAAELDVGVARKVFESLSFNVSGKDDDGDAIRLYLTGDGFDPDAYAMSFPEVEGVGNVAGMFDWKLLCEHFNLAERDTFALHFVVVDTQNKCRIQQADSLRVTVVVKPPDNAAPLLNVSSTNPDLPFVDLRQEVLLGQQVSLGLVATDGDVSPADHLVIDLVSVEGNVPPEGYVFERAEGRGNVQTTFAWNPDCSIFTNGQYQNDYTFTFRAYDDRCHNQLADTVVVKMTVRDFENDVMEFLPPNFVSADRDPESRNEFFGMVRIDEQTGTLENILPKDNCTGHFVGISIYNRWGSVVFTSTDRDFRWYPHGEAAGVYYYTLTFSDREYKGLITVRN